MTRSRLITAILLVAGACALAACDPVMLRDSPSPTPRPARAAPPTQPEITQPSEASRALSSYFARIQQNFLTRGLLRVDGGGPDTPFTSRQLVDNFIRIALYQEFSSVDGVLIRRENASQLNRWNGPIRMSVDFSASVPADQRARDRREIVNYSQRLARLSGLNISLSPGNANYHILIVSEDERVTLGPKLRALGVGFNEESVAAVQNMGRATYCQIFAFYDADTNTYTHAVAVIRAENPDLLRLSCIHEELAQGLGLPNDSPQARPSIFNDDEEFGLLTTHDEFLLRMLYDPRLRPGMTATQARPIAETIAAELMGGES
ncbi:MAG: DUF2927 domain-containing protein [Rhodobacter sp.]|nr:DUF2927 domain-containing protein [Rhodobacter sp.]